MNNSELEYRRGWEDFWNGKIYDIFENLSWQEGWLEAQIRWNQIENGDD